MVGVTGKQGLGFGRWKAWDSCGEGGLDICGRDSFDEVGGVNVEVVGMVIEAPPLPLPSGKGIRDH